MYFYSILESTELASVKQNNVNQGLRHVLLLCYYLNNWATDPVTLHSTCSLKYYSCIEWLSKFWDMVVPHASILLLQRKNIGHYVLQPFLFFFSFFTFSAFAPKFYCLQPEMLWFIRKKLFTFSVNCSPKFH